MSLDNILTVLVQTHHPGNIGSSARALKTMGLSKLSLVNPVSYPDPDAERMAAGAVDVLQQSQVISNLEDEIRDTALVIACTARPRGFDLPVLEPEKAAQMLVEHAKNGKVAVLFGPERFGLSNEHLKLARYRVTLDTNPDYPSLNLAAAVQVMAYEVRKAFRAIDTDSAGNASDLTARNMPSTDDVERFYVHLETTLYQSGFIVKQHPGKIMDKLRFLFGRAAPDAAELRILRGILASFQRERTSSQD